MPANASGELAAIAARLRVLGDKGVTKEFRAGLRAAAGPLVADVKSAALSKLPHGGGLNAQVAGQKVTISVPLSARTAAVRLRTTAPDTGWTDAGFVRHPVFGGNSWVTQSIPGATGWWSDTLSNDGPKVTAELLGVMALITAQLEGV